MSTILPATSLSVLTGPQAAASSPPTRDGLWGEDGFSFHDFLDIINPLQHIPLLDAAYRAITGDEISSGAKVVGDTLLAGPIGFMASLVDISVEEQTGADIGTHLIAMLTGKEAADTDAVATLTDATSSPVIPVTTAPNLPLSLIPPREGEAHSMAKPLPEFYAEYRKAAQLSASYSLEPGIIA